MKPDMIRILKAMFSNNGKMEFKEIVRLLNLLSEQTRYYLDKLETKEFIKPLRSPFLVHGPIGNNEEFYELTAKGRAYVMESLMLSDTFSKHERDKRERTKQKRFQMNFYKMGIPEGAILKNKKTNDEVRVIDSKTVAFRGEEMSLTRATQIILNVDSTPSITHQWLYEGESLHLIYNRTYRNYGKVAIEVTKYIQETKEHPMTAWNNFTEEVFGKGSSGANKSCPRSAYLGLCEDGLVAGVPKGNYTREQKGKKLNKLYAVQAVRMLCTNPFLENDSPDELWNEVMEALGNVPKNHDNQMNVVLALWHEGMIVKTDAKEIDTKYDIYSKRIGHTKVSQVEIPKTLRKQVFSILEEIIGNSEWKSLWRGFCIEKEMPLKEEVTDYNPQNLLNVDNLYNNDKAVIEENWLHCRNQIEDGTMEDIFDLVDIAFQFTYKKIQNMYLSGRDRWEKEVLYRQAVRDINIRFKEAKVDHQLVRNRMVHAYSNNRGAQKKTKQERIDSLVEWFRENYQDPVNISSYFGTEDASRLIDDGPYRAKDILVGHFPEESEEIIDASVEKIESVGVILWYSILKPEKEDEPAYNSDFKSVEAELNSLIANSPTSRIAPAFDFGQDGLLHISSPPDLQDVASGNKLFEELKVAKDDLKQLLDGTNEYLSLLEAVKQYDQVFSDEGISISFLYARGIRLENAIAATRKSIESGEFTHFSTDTEENINSVLELHATYIMSHEEGRLLVGSASAYAQSPQQAENIKIAAKNINISVAEDTILFGEDVKKQVANVTQDIGKGAHPERSNQVARNVFIGLTTSLLGAVVMASEPGMYLVVTGSKTINAIWSFLPTIILSLKMIVASMASDTSWLASISDLVERIRNLQNPPD